MTENKKLHVVLAGQANVGKSVIFNHFTGLHQHIGNWPGKTIEKAEGTLFYNGYTIDVLDLPGIYSLSSSSAEEVISREYITVQKPDFIINVLDSTSLERNLLFTLQLLELEKPMIVALNMADMAKKKGIDIDYIKLERILGVPVVGTIASRRYGLTDVLDRGIELLEGKMISPEQKSHEHETPIIIRRKGEIYSGSIKYGKEVENRIEKLINAISDGGYPYPNRWIAIKLLEQDEEVKRLVKEKNPDILKKAEKLCLELEEIHGHDSSVVIADERCHLVSRITGEIVKIIKSHRTSFAEKLDALRGGGVNLEFIIARRTHEKAKTGVVFVTPIRGAKQLKAAKKAGFKKARSLHGLRVSCSDKRGLGAKLTTVLAEAGINLRGFSGAAIAKKAVFHLAFDTNAAAGKAATLLKKAAAKI